MLSNVKKALTCQHIGAYEITPTFNAIYTPKMGDVAIFKVVQPNGGYIMGAEGRSINLFEGDLVMLAFGSRYATNQYEGYVPAAPVNECQLLGRGGVAGILTSKNASFRAVPAQLSLVGYAINEMGQVLNTIRYHELDTFNADNIKAKVIISIGSSMDSGKTTSAAWLCGGLAATGAKVAYIKLTGTTFPKDAALNMDRGAQYAIDFSHFGFPSTYLLDRATLLNLYQSLVNLAVEEGGAEYIVMEIADGLLQRETAMLLEDPRFRATIYATLFSSGDSLGVLSGLQLLNKWDISPFGVSGLFTASELLIREVEGLIDTPILRLSDLLSTKIDHLVGNPILKSSLTNILQLERA